MVLHRQRRIGCLGLPASADLEGATLKVSYRDCDALYKDPAIRARQALQIAQPAGEVIATDVNGLSTRAPLHLRVAPKPSAASEPSEASEPAAPVAVTAEKQPVLKKQTEAG